MRASVKFLKDLNLTEQKNDLARTISKFRSDRRELIRDMEDLLRNLRAYRYSRDAERRARNAIAHRNKDLLRSGKEIIKIKESIAYTSSDNHDSIEGTSETFMLLMDRIVSKDFNVERRDNALMGEYFLLEDNSVPRITIAIPSKWDACTPLSRTISVKVGGTYTEVFTEEELNLFNDYFRIPVMRLYEQMEREEIEALANHKRQKAHNLILGLYKKAGIK